MMLKIKEQLNYRRGGTSRNCGGCDHFVRNHQCLGIGGEDLGKQPRCAKIGLKPGRFYQINENSLCDAYCNEEGLRRLLGEKAFVKLKETRHAAA